MKIFDSFEDKFWRHKINFVDDNNTVVGYELEQQCCEKADWFISSEFVLGEITQKSVSRERNWEGYQFDKSFFADVPCIRLALEGCINEGDAVVFRLVNVAKMDEKFLYLYNIQNGYYSHGFEMIADNSKVRTGDI